jgi:hypothetical protein
LSPQPTFPILSMTSPFQVESERTRAEVEALVRSGEARAREMAARADQEEERLAVARKKMESDEAR